MAEVPKAEVPKAGVPKAGVPKVDAVTDESKAVVGRGLGLP